MKAINTLSLAALALTATTFLACSNDNLTIENNPTKQDKIVTLTATLSSKGGTYTKALTDPGDGTLSSTWAVSEEIEVQYEKSTDPADSPSGSAKATVTAVDGSGKATITVDLVDPKDGNTGIYFHYPYSLATGTKNLNNDQTGTLADIEANFDDITGDGTLNVSGGVATLPTGVAMTRNVCVWKFSFTDGSSDITSAVTALNIKVGSISEYNVAPSSQSAIYVAMSKANNQPITITAATATGNYSYSKSGITLDNGNFYRSDVAMSAAAASNTYRVFTTRTAYTDEAIPGGVTIVGNSATAVSWTAGTYVVNSDVLINGDVTLAGNVNLILCAFLLNSTTPGCQH